MQPHEQGPDDQGRIWDFQTRTFRQQTDEEKAIQEAAEKGFGPGHKAPEKKPQEPPTTSEA